MKVLLILTGPSGSGKTSFVRRNQLQDYSVSLDELRKRSLGHSYSASGSISIDSRTPTEIRMQFKNTIESRLNSGLFTVIDGTNLNSTDFKYYVDLSKTYGYSLYYKKFKLSRTAYNPTSSRLTHYIPDNAILKQIDKAEKLVIPTKAKEIDSLYNIPEFSSFYEEHQLSNDVCIIGDIHSCYKELKEFIDTEYNLQDMFIFTGDYIDRGYDPTRVITLLSSIARNGNVVLLEGNHERWLRYWSVNRLDLIKNKGFLETTQHQLTDITEGGILKRSKAVSFCKLLRTHSNVKIGSKRLLISHGGVSILNPLRETTLGEFNFPSSEYFIKGAGRYSDLKEFYETGSKDYDAIIHGHRNLGDKVFKEYHDEGTNTAFFNLEGGVEYGGELRYLKIPKDYNGEYADLKVSSIQSSYNALEDINNLVKDFRSKPKDILERTSNTTNITSFNFSRDVFYSKRWTKLNCVARGLFIYEDGDSNNTHIVGRGYSKFFNLGENSFTDESALKGLKYPLKAYKKYNGFLGILYSHNGELVYNSKAGDYTDSAERFKEIFIRVTTQEFRDNLQEKLESINSSAVFEVRIPERDNLSYFPKKDSLVALDIISNSVVFTKLSYDELRSFYGGIKGLMNILIKQIADDLIKNYDELIAFINSESLIRFEGYVFEDLNGFMFKWKSPIYNVLKTLRASFNTGDYSSTYRSLVIKGLLDNKTKDREFYLTKDRLKDMIDDLSRNSEFPSDLSSLQQFMIQGSLKD